MGFRKTIGTKMAKLGAKMWQPAFDKGYQDDYKMLTFSEKLGFYIFDLGLRIGDLTEFY